MQCQIACLPACRVRLFSVLHLYLLYLSRDYTAFDSLLCCSSKSFTTSHLVVVAYKLSILVLNHFGNLQTVSDGQWQESHEQFY